MKRKEVFVGVAALFLFTSATVAQPSLSLGAEKLNFGTSFKNSIEMSLTALAVEEQGFWKKYDLEVKWTPFVGGEDFYRGLAAGSLEIGLGDVADTIRTMVRGVPQLIIADLRDPRYFYLWVRSDGPIKQPKDLKGAKIAVVRFGAASHIFAQVIVKGLGLGKETQFVSVGSLPAQLATLKRGTVTAFVQTRAPVARSLLEGEIRELIGAGEYLPKKWVAHIALARQDLIRRKPEIVGRAVKAIIEGKDSIMKNPAWAKEKLISYLGYPDKVADYLVRDLNFDQGGQIEREAFENVMKFLVEYGILEKEKALPVEQVYTTQFVK